MNQQRMSAGAMVTAVLALVAALAGTAVAGPDATTSAVSKKKVKKIATKQIKKLAPDLSVAEAANAEALGGRAPSAFASSSSEAYREIGAPGQPQFQNNWQNNTQNQATAAFYKDPVGVVHVKGEVTSGTEDQPMFTLPAGYRPAKGQSYVTGHDQNGNVGFTTVASNGNVIASCSFGNCLAVSLNSITFRAQG